MRMTVTVIALTLILGVEVMAQENALTSALDSPIKMQAEKYGGNESLVCSLVLPASAALFGTDYDDATEVFVTNELFSPFRVFSFDRDCIPMSSWSTAIAAGATVTGIGYPNSTNGTTYWVCEPFGSATISEYFIGGVATGSVLPVPAGGSVWGSLVVDSNKMGEVLCINEIALDSTTCINAETGGTVICVYGNADNAGGGGAFGNGTSDAVAPGECSGQTLVNASGTITEGQVVRAGQYDCTGNDPACTDRWDFSITASTFINGIAEYASAAGDRNMMCVDNTTSTLFALAAVLGIADCQPVDPDMDLIWINGSQGGSDFALDVDTRSTLAVGIQRTAAGNGEFAFHMVIGEPDQSTIMPLRDLGNSCFRFILPLAPVVSNNLGKTNLLGTSHYFGPPTADPAKAPTFVPTLLQPNVDVGNLAAGTSWTSQLIALNGAASSRLGGALSNGVVMRMK